jgi:hypothetical protein
VHGFVAWIPIFRNGYKLTHYAGKDDGTTVPEDIGRLELIIHHLHESDLGDSGSDSSDDRMSGGPNTLQQQARKHIASQSDEENSKNGEDNSEDDGGDGSKDDSKDGSKDDSEDNSEDDKLEHSDGPEYGGDSYGGRAARRGAKRSKGAMRNGATTEFTTVKNVKPRQTHSAE